MPVFGKKVVHMLSRCAPLDDRKLFSRLVHLVKCLPGCNKLADELVAGPWGPGARKEPAIVL